jgi:hypothetical protein
VPHGVRQERRESERSLQSSKDQEDVVVGSTPCSCLILSIQLIFVRKSRLQVVWIVFLFRDFQSIFIRFFIREFGGVFLSFLPWS